ncbi:hypothetical protein DOM22_05160 [Bdellovibrio sp. ZAP7]|uniref:lipocalin family protein n=1 Tax=Bdellovibrio sp. ZAP7 TaxID=2231053 RepID=UPI00115870B8|nr:lipocalin family protein [Bdellovibrio sp. ZAP7]QDK44590.1 hypothetical protein DOM22_05160 [Bdellovibrio sp. ZAP7]
MKNILSLFVLLSICGFSWGPSKDSSDPEVVSSVDFSKYVGFWYEVAHAPNFFQRGCVRSTAEYAVLTPQSVSVKNTCYKENGSTTDIHGQAYVVDPAVPAKLKVKFNIFAKGDYWIVDLDPNYQWAVVSGPKKKSLFILSRQAPMEPLVLKQLITSLKNRGFDTDNLIYDKY